jgi:HNH endonuclease/AP2 domain
LPKQEADLVAEKLTAERARAIFSYDKSTGIIRWRENPERAKNWNTRFAGKPAGCLFDGRIQIRFEGVLYLAHRLAWLIETGEWPPFEIDHENGKPSENWWDNLRPATHAQNMFNRAKQSNNSSGYTGVRYREHHGKWEGRINIAGKTVWREYFETVQEAATARREALTKTHGEFAIKNPDRPLVYCTRKARH